MVEGLQRVSNQSIYARLAYTDRDLSHDSKRDALHIVEKFSLGGGNVVLPRSEKRRVVISAIRECYLQSSRSQILTTIPAVLPIEHSSHEEFSPFARTRVVRGPESTALISAQGSTGQRTVVLLVHATTHRIGTRRWHRL